jgi:hypothetical protein
LGPFLGGVRKIKIADNNFLSTHTGISAWTIYSNYIDNPITYFMVTGNTAGSPLENTNSVNFLSCDEYAELLVVRNNTLYIQKSNPQSGLLLGVDGDTGSHPMGMVMVENNHIEYTGTHAGHAILLGSGVDSGSCIGNVILGRDLDANAAIGIIVKGEGNYIANNVVLMKRGIYLKGGAMNKIVHNSVLALNGFALQWLISTDSPMKNVIYNNIFWGGAYALYISNGEGGNNYLDYNCYVPGSSGLAYDEENAAAYASLTALRAQWTNQTNWSGLHLFVSNDAHSIEADPKFKDPFHGDFALLPGSPCIGSGMPTPGGGKTTIGAYQTQTLGDEVECGYKLAGDLDADCKVDLEDMIMMATHWLVDCVLEPDTPACLPME